MKEDPRSTRGRRWIGWALALVATIVVVINQRDVGIARDEVVYMQNGAHYADWWTGLVTFDHGVSEASVTRTFGGPNATDNNREHPPLMKTLFGLSDKLLHRTLGVAGEVTAFRLPSAVMHGVLVLLAYLMVLELWGTAQAIVAALLVVLLPRAIFHAGLACFDAPTMTLWFATIYAYWRGLDGRRWPWQVGVVWGLALATKHTALLLPFALGAHYLIAAWRARSHSPGAAGATRRARALATVRAVLGYRWRVIVSLAVLGPLTLYAVWPWLWFDPVHHVQDWLAFHLHHVHYNYEYLGRNWNAPRFPWHVALVTTLFTVPAGTLAAAIIGAGVWIAERTRRDPSRIDRFRSAAQQGSESSLRRGFPLWGSARATVLARAVGGSLGGAVLPRHDADLRRREALDARATDDLHRRCGRRGVGGAHGGRLRGEAAPSSRVARRAPCHHRDRRQRRPRGGDRDPGRRALCADLVPTRSPAVHPAAPISA